MHHTIETEQLNSGLTQLLKATLKDVDLKRGGHDLPQPVVDQHQVKVLVNFQGDAQDAVQLDMITSYQR